MTKNNTLLATEAVAFLPWLVLPEPVRIGGFTFAPWHATRPEQPLGSRCGELLAQAAKSYIDLHGRSVDACTVIGYPRCGWNIRPRDFDRIRSATRLLALTVLSNQRFFEAPLAPYINAAAFRPVLQPFAASPDRLSVLICRRGGDVLLGGSGIVHGNVIFQCPLSLHGANPPLPDRRLARALDRARTTYAPMLARIEAALPLWLLANADDPTLPIISQLTLAAAAFEQLLGPFPRDVALNLANRLSELFAGFGAVTLSESKRRLPDPRWRDAQSVWYLHQKWIKEIYELRNVQMHGNAQPDLSRNWTPEEHQVVAAFVFPLAVKLLLCSESLYAFSERERGACRALDLLLESDDWGFRWNSQRRWSKILSREEAAAELCAIITTELGKSRIDSTDPQAEPTQ